MNLPRFSGFLLLTSLFVTGCPVHTPNDNVASHSSSMAISPDGTLLYVANPDSDSVSVVNTTTRTLVKEILLNGVLPAIDSTGRYTPAVSPRAVSLSPTMNRLFVSGHRSSSLYSIDVTTNTVSGQVHVGSEPAGVLIAKDDSKVYVACSNDSSVVAVDPATMKVTATAQIGQATGQMTEAKPWGLAWAGDYSAVYVSLLLGTGVVSLNPSSLKVNATWLVPDSMPRSDPRLAYGQVRGIYDVAARPGSIEVWSAHLMLANATAEPTLDFETTAFPTLSILHNDGEFDAHLSTNAQDVPGLNGAFGDIVSGPRAFQFTADGRYLLMVDSGSEDVLAVDAVNRVESSLLRPLPGHQPEGIVLSPDGTMAYVQERNSGDVAVISVDTSGSSAVLNVVGNTIPLYATDPMPAQIRQGQHMFNSANSDEMPITQNHWISCSICHVEGRSDGITWQFLEGPRDTPSNAGGTLDTGFLLHTADRRLVNDYWRVINNEQGGQFGDTLQPQIDDLAALAAYVNEALPIPIPPTTNPTLVAQGLQAFEKAGCSACHLGPALTDSGEGNPMLDLSSPVVTAWSPGDAPGVLLHDVGTCNTGSYPDLAYPADDMSVRQACLFDTPALRGVADSAPYLHDGSEATLSDLLTRTAGKMGNINVLSAAEQAALIEYLRSL